MAQRTYWDAFGYKKKKRKRGTKQYGTIAEMKADIAAKKIASMEENPCKLFRGVQPKKEEGLIAIEKIIDHLVLSAATSSHIV